MILAYYHAQYLAYQCMTICSYPITSSMNKNDCIVSFIIDVAGLLCKQSIKGIRQRLQLTSYVPSSDIEYSYNLLAVFFYSTYALKPAKILQNMFIDIASSKRHHRNIWWQRLWWKQRITTICMSKIVLYSSYVPVTRLTGNYWCSFD